MIDEERLSIQMLRQRLPTTWSLYSFLVENQKIFLPPWKNRRKRPKWATAKYLEGILADKFFLIKRDQVRKPGKGGESVSKGELVDFLGALVDKELGFEKEREPSVKWLRKVLYSINPQHKIFQTATMKMERTIPKAFD